MTTNIIANTTVGSSCHPPMGSTEGYGDLCFYSANVDWSSMKEDFSNVNWRGMMSEADPDQNLGTLLTKVLEICRRYVPRRKPARRSKGVPRRHRILMRKRAKLNKKSKKKNITNNTDNA